MTTTYLDNKYQTVLKDIFEYPVSDTITWRNITIFMEHIGDVKTKNNGQLTFTVNGVPRIFHPSKDEDTVDIVQVQEMRDFLESVGIGQDSVINSNNTQQLFVVITQKETLIFRSEEKGTMPTTLHPDDPHGLLHHLNHSHGGDMTAHSPENLTYYEAIAETLIGADEILLMGHGTGSGNAMIHLKEFLKTHYLETANKIVGSLTTDVEAMTRGQMLHAARTFFRQREGL
jgi:hypothetical protein